MNRLQPLGLHQNQQNRRDDQGPFIENCIGISPSNLAKKNTEYENFFWFVFLLVPATKVDDLAKIYDEKLRLLRK